MTVEEAADVWGDYTSWPIDGTQNVDVFLRGTSTATAPGTLGGAANGGDVDTLGFTASTGTSEATLMGTPTGAQTNRRVFLSRPLTTDLRLSGTAAADIAASLGATQSNLSVVVAEYGVTTQVSRTDEGIVTGTTRSCWGASSADETDPAAPAAPRCRADSPLGSACSASGAQVENACYLNVSKPAQTTSATTGWRVTRGIVDSSNRDSLWYLDATPVTIGQSYRFKIPTMPQEHIFKAGSRIGIIIGGSNTSMASGTGTNNVAVTLDTRTSKITLPIKGGYAAAVAASLTDAETVAPVLGAVPADIATETTDPTGTAVTFTNPTATDNEDPNPAVTCTPASGSKFAIGTTTVSCTAKDANGNESAAKTFNVVVKRLVPVNGTVGGSVGATLSLTLGAPVQFGVFTPGITKPYLASTTATVISTAGDATLSVADPSAFGTGHLVNGTFVLPQPLQARGRNAANTGTAYNNVGSSASPLNLLTYSGPVSNDAVSLEFSQLVNSTDPLRTGTYSKALTFTLSTTTP